MAIRVRNSYRGDLVWRPWASVDRSLHALAIDPSCGLQMLVWKLLMLERAP